MYSIVLVFLASGATIACCLFSFGDDVTRGVKAAAYAWLVSAGLGWLRVTIGLMEEAYGDKAPWLFEMSKVYKDKLSPALRVLRWGRSITRGGADPRYAEELTFGS